MAVYGIGIDAIELDRVHDAASDPEFEARILHPSERVRPFDAAALARRWAVKEAVAKAVGTHLRWHDVRLFEEDDGCERVEIERGAAPEGLQVHITASVAGGLAFACVVAQLPSGSS